MTQPRIEQTSEAERLHVLMIEDNPHDAEFLQIHLDGVKRRKISSECCEWLEAGLRRLAQGAVDLVFLDLTLPDSTGIDSLLRIRLAAPGVPVVILTGTDDDTLALQALKSGAQDYLIKGQLDPSSLGRSISYALERQHNSNASRFLASVVDSSNDAIIGNSLDNIVLSWNTAAQQMYGYKASEIIGRSIKILQPPDRVDDSAMILDKIKSGEKVEHHHTKRRRKDGSCIEVSITASAITDSEGLTVGASVVARDITQEVESEKSLKEVNERFNRAINASKIGLWEWDLKETFHWDSGMYRLFGVIEKQFIPSFENFLQCMCTNDRQRVKEAMERSSIAGGAFDFDFCIKWPGADKHYLRVNGAVLCDQQGRPLRMTGVCSDISERKIAEAALLDSEQRLSLALESAKMGVWDLNLADNTVWRSRDHDRIFGYDLKLPEWSYETFLHHVIPEDRTLVQQAFKAASEEPHYHMECRILHFQDKSIHWIATQGKAYLDECKRPARVMGTVTDITTRKKLEQQAFESQQRRETISQTIVEHAPIGILILDSELRVGSANPAFLSMFDRDLREILDLPLTTVLPYEMLETAVQSLKDGKMYQIFRLQVSITCKQAVKRKKYMDLSLWPISDEKSNLLGGVVQIIDCTDKILLEQQRDDFVASVIHDIKNPLIGAQRIFDAMCNQSLSFSSTEHARMLSILQESNCNLLALLQNLIDVYRYETFSFPCHYEEINLSSLIESCFKQITSFAETREVTLHKNGPDTVRVQADPMGIRRVLANLVQNAIKFNKHGGRVDVSVEQLDDTIQIEITDTGDGISESEQSGLFQRFAQGSAGKRHSSGTGLGLYISKQIVEAHRGSITCHSKVGAGTTFVIILPVDQPILVAENRVPCP